MANTKIQMIDPGRLVPHPDNREFKEEGPEWEAFVESIRFHGVLQPLMARKHGHDWQVVAGHRRRRGSIVAQLKEVPVIVRELSDKQAIEIVFIENLHREELSLVEEARGVRGMIGVGMSPEEIASRISRDVRWVKTRQLLFDLGDEVIEAAKLPKEDPKHLGVRTIEEILKVPEEMRNEAIQLVLHNDLFEGTLSPLQAKDVLQNQLVKPRLAQIEWEKGRKSFTKAWKDRLKAHLAKGTKKDLLILSVPWEETERITKAGRGAEVKVPVEEQTAEAPQFLMWLHLAVRHGQAVKVVHDPAGGQDKSFAVVDMRVLRDAEEALGEAVVKARHDLANAEAELAEGVDGAAGRVDELRRLIASSMPWLVTRALGKVSVEAPVNRIPAVTTKNVTCVRCSQLFFAAKGERRCGQCGEDCCEECMNEYLDGAMACAKCIKAAGRSDTADAVEEDEEPDLPAEPEGRAEGIREVLDAVGLGIGGASDEVGDDFAHEPELVLVDLEPVHAMLAAVSDMPSFASVDPGGDIPTWAGGMCAKDVNDIGEWILSLRKPEGGEG